jgi:ADP-ribosyl-[dinitrogen reductase] hydrolase
LKTIQDRFEACMIAGAIGDAWGSGYENAPVKQNNKTFYWGKPQQPEVRRWAITDDTQLTLATCEVLCDEKGFSVELLAEYFLKYYQQKKITGIGASTLQAMKALEVGGHWSQVGRMGEYAASNGAAMRIAPLAFFSYISRETIRDVCRITHKNDEAYVGVLAVFLSLKLIIEGKWTGGNNLIELLIPQLPDTNIRDRLVEINKEHRSSNIADVSKLGNSGYVVNSVPFAIFSAMQVQKLGFERMIEQVIATGGDTDTNASIAGQIAGAFLGTNLIATELIDKLKQLREYNWMSRIISKAKAQIS